MAPNTRRVFHVNELPAPVFAEIIAGRLDVQLDGLFNESPDELAEPILAQAHAYQIGATRDELAAKYHGTAALLARAPNLLAISSNGAGYDTVDVPACTAAGVAVVNQTGGNKEGVAEHVLAMMLALSKRVGEADRAMRRQKGVRRIVYKGHDVAGRTIGIIGIGNIGSRVAELCRGLFRMRVLAYDPYLTAEQITERGAEKVELHDLLRVSHYVSVNCPLTAETRGMIGAEQYALMRADSYFITTARGGIHNEAALADALASGRIAGAGLDVWEKEPRPGPSVAAIRQRAGQPAHCGGDLRSRHNIGRLAAEQMLDMLGGKRPPRLINPEVWPLYRQRFVRILGFMPGL